VQTNGRHRRILIRSREAYWQWSPRGDLLAVLVDANGSRARLLIIDPRDGSVRVRAKSVVSGFFWSPTGKWIALFRDDPNGKNPHLLTGRLGEPGLYVLARDPWDAAWSPNGKRIAFTRGSSIVLSRPDGSSARVLTSGFRPRWSPTGEWISFVRGHSTDTKLDAFAIRPGGSDLRPLGTDTCRGGLWSPDGGRIEIAHRCYSFVDVDPISEIVDLARGRRWSLGVGAGIWDSSGKRLAFYRRYRDRDLRIIDPDGSHPTVVATSAEFEGWSPVGRRFLLEGQSEIQLARDDGRAIPWHFAAGFDAYWSPNGREIIYLQRQRVPCGQVLMIKNVRGGKARPLARCG